MCKCIRTIWFLLLFGLVVGCGTREEPADVTAYEGEENRAQDIVIPVEAQHPHRGIIAAYFETTTRVTAENQVEVTSEGVGKCIKVYVDEGDTVKQGDILVDLDKEEALASLRETEVQVRKQRSDFEIAQKSLQEGLISRSEYDNARFAHEQGIATLNSQKVQLENLTIRTPISGVVTKRNIQLGILVSSGAPVFSIVDPTSFHLAINPPERELQRLHIGQEAKVTIDALPNEEFAATVSRVNPSVDAVTGTVKVLLDFNEADLRNLREAAFARVRLVMETHENALLVPKDALVEENARKYLFVAKESSVSGQDTAASTGDETQASGDVGESGSQFIADRVEVEAGLEDSDFVEIVSGIDENALVITRGHYNLKPGAQVKLTNAEAELAAKIDLSAEEALRAARARRDEDAEQSKRGRMIRHGTTNRNR